MCLIVGIHIGALQIIVEYKRMSSDLRLSYISILSSLPSTTSSLWELAHFGEPDEEGRVRGEDGCFLMKKQEDARKNNYLYTWLQVTLH